MEDEEESDDFLEPSSRNDNSQGLDWEVSQDATGGEPY
jgi:hypothetical protein